MSKHFDSAAKDWDKNTQSRERALAIAEKIRVNLPLEKTWKGLEFGSGTGALGMELVDNIGYLDFADTSTGMLEEVRKKIQSHGLEGKTGTIDLSANGVLGKNYHLIFTVMVLHHIQNVRQQLQELADCLEQGGYLVLADLVEEPGDFHPGGGHGVHHHGFAPSQMEGYLSDLGMELVHSGIGYVNRKEIEGELREFPVFLIIGQKQ